MMYPSSTTQNGDGIQRDNILRAIEEMGGDQPLLGK